MARLADYVGRRIDFQEREVEGWKRDHDAAEAVWILEAIFKEMLSNVEALAEFDTKLNLTAAKTGDVDELDAWDVAYKAIAERQLKVFARFKEVADKCNVYSYKDCKIERGLLEQYEKRLWGVVNPSDEYLERGDVNDAIRGSEEDLRRGDFKVDKIKNA